MINVLPLVTQYTTLIPQNEHLPPISLTLKDHTRLNILTPTDIDELNNQHFVIKDNVFIDIIDSKTLITDCLPYFEKDAISGKMGQREEKWQNNNIRGDKIWWINDSTEIPKSLSSLVQMIKKLQIELNESTNLNSQFTQSHLTCYPGNNTGYIRHLDATTKSHSNRKLTCLFYLNQDWKPGDGGELMIYGDNKNIKVRPISNRLLIFQSGCVEHQVLSTLVPRYAFTLWMC